MKLTALLASTGTITAIAFPGLEATSSLPAGAPLSLLGVVGLLLLTWDSERWRPECRTTPPEPATLHLSPESVADRS